MGSRTTVRRWELRRFNSVHLHTCIATSESKLKISPSVFCRILHAIAQISARKVYKTRVSPSLVCATLLLGSANSVQLHGLLGSLVTVPGRFLVQAFHQSAKLAK